MMEVSVAELDRRETAYAAGVLARGMRDNPNHVAAFGDDPQRRVRISELIFRSVLRMMKQPALHARREAWVVGVCGLAAPGTCRPALFERLRMAPVMLRCGPGTASRMLSWMGEWAKHDPAEPHWHLGPVAVEGGLQGLGIGSQMMESFCARVDSAKEAAYLETDKAENVPFYEKFGFRVVAEAPVLGQPNWFMVREAGAK